jgi:hypothetical protein
MQVLRRLTAGAHSEFFTGEGAGVDNEAIDKPNLFLFFKLML